MSLDEELKTKYPCFFSKYEALRKEGEVLVPLVLAHFNDYIRDVINPALSGEVWIGKSDHAFYSGGGKFIVSTGPYQTRTGPTKGPLDIETIVMDLLDAYEQHTPWIEKIWEGFSLSR